MGTSADKKFYERVIDEITEEQILKLLRDYGTEPYRIKDNEIWFRTVCHNGHSHKLCYFRDSKDFYCYTNCGKMSLFNLIMNVDKCNFIDSLKKVCSIAGISITKDKKGFPKIINPELTYLKQRKERLKKKKAFDVNPLKSIDSNILNYFSSDIYYQGWIDEGISIEAMDKFNIKWYELEKHIIIPHYDLNGNLVGIRRRSLQEKDKKNKYMPEDQVGLPYTYNFAHSLGMNLYGLYENKTAIKKYQTAIIVEAEKSVLLSDSYFGDDSIAIATCGFNISNWQRNMLLHLGVSTVILAFDNDYPYVDFKDIDEENLGSYSAEEREEFHKYKNYIYRIDSLGKKFAPFCTTYKIWDQEGLLGKKDSPFDKGKKVFNTLMKNKIEITI